MSRQKIQDNEFDDWLQLDEEDTNWVAQQTAQGVPVVLPWKKQASDKSSIRASLRCGVVELERNPRLCHEALAMLKYGGGYTAFTEQYGDYFVWGYRLGGDTGLMISSSSFEKKKVEQYGIELTVEVLFVEMSHRWTKDFYTYSAGKKMRLLGYDTLSDTNWNVAMETSRDIEKLSEHAEEVILRSQDLLERSIKILEDQGMFHGDHLTNAQCDFLTNRGIVVELILLPMSALRDVARWTTERNAVATCAKQQNTTFDTYYLKTGQVNYYTRAEEPPNSKSKCVRLDDFYGSLSYLSQQAPASMTDKAKKAAIQLCLNEYYHKKDPASAYLLLGMSRSAKAKSPKNAVAWFDETLPILNGRIEVLQKALSGWNP
ncbi:hypothetical protein CORC01_03723 [Colletotrichum orchidophilum]|uniref:Uncharacterized protein n=1 Tax=Colletotrichum orchidophilum TaxID=1209926 RepID=A0A1G4BHP5_9PEZI|nr:uncharacterized protein CORC01_03723 [Colletotrichum orchidophilum]OHF00895.1 hypothetical protein CORC01_03723 [Colletotrichum orchidophilum]